MIRGNCCQNLFTFKEGFKNPEKSPRKWARSVHKMKTGEDAPPLNPYASFVMKYSIAEWTRI